MRGSEREARQRTNKLYWKWEWNCRQISGIVVEHQPKNSPSLLQYTQILLLRPFICFPQNCYCRCLDCLHTYKYIVCVRARVWNGQKIVSLSTTTTTTAAAMKQQYSIDTTYATGSQTKKCDGPKTTMFTKNMGIKPCATSIEIIAVSSHPLTPPTFSAIQMLISKWSFVSSKQPFLTNSNSSSSFRCRRRRRRRRCCFIYSLQRWNKNHKLLLTLTFLFSFFLPLYTRFTICGHRLAFSLQNHRIYQHHRWRWPNIKTKIHENLLGLYLYMLVVETFSGDNLKFKMYALIGWGKLIALFPSLFFHSFVVFVAALKPFSHFSCRCAREIDVEIFPCFARDRIRGEMGKCVG